MSDVWPETETFDRYARLVRRVLGAPAATVTVIEPDRQVYRGASGLPPELEEARETPLPYALCKLVVDDQDPVVVDDLRVEPRTADHLAVTELGVVAYAGWPLTDYHGEVVGSVCAMDMEPREWSEDDIKVLRDIARACSSELSERERRFETEAARAHAEELADFNQQLLEERTEAVLVLQNSLLSPPPTVAGLRTAVRYRPAVAHEKVGGDWYDAFVPPDGDLRLVIGDVAGHDVNATAAMGQIRSMLRMSVWGSEDGSLSGDLQRLDRAMAALDVDSLASAVLVRVGEPDPGGVRVLTMSNAGHPPPLLVHADGTARFLHRVGDDGLLDAEGPMLGADPEVERLDTVAEMGPGATLLLYTDGLVERRGRDVGDGLDALLDAVVALSPADPETVADRVLEDLGMDTVTDDTALLVVRLDD